MRTQPFLQTSQLIKSLHISNKLHYIIITSNANYKSNEQVHFILVLVAVSINECPGELVQTCSRLANQCLRCSYAQSMNEDLDSHQNLEGYPHCTSVCAYFKRGFCPCSISTKISCAGPNLHWSIYDNKKNSA